MQPVDAQETVEQRQNFLGEARVIAFADRLGEDNCAADVLLQLYAARFDNMRVHASKPGLARQAKFREAACCTRRNGEQPAAARRSAASRAQKAEKR